MSGKYFRQTSESLIEMYLLCHYSKFFQNINILISISSANNEPDIEMNNNSIYLSR